MSPRRSAVTALAALAAPLLLTASVAARDLPPDHRGRIPDQTLAALPPAPPAETAPRRLPPLQLQRAVFPGALRDRAGAPAGAEPDLPGLLVPARTDAPLRQVEAPASDPPRWSNPGAVSL